ncbi:MAG: hypothetical protein EOO55_01385 [Hymenobacter sp.]|nr:MAG: hypothetical protein EOO55_01385 [Hymenobacter sp.]
MPRWQESNTHFYIGVEGITLANRFTQFTASAPSLAATDKDLAPRPALLAGYQFSPRWAVETHVQDLAVLTGYSYQQQSATDYLGFGQSYTQDYLYIPVHAIYKVLGVNHRVGLSIIAGGGPAWTDTKESLITPNGTQVFYGASNGVIGTGSTSPAGTVSSATVTQLVTQQQSFLAAFEAGLRGSWLVVPHLSLHITVRQLWSTTHSVRDMNLAIQTTNGTIFTVMTTPLRGIATGLGIHYAF